MGAPLVSRENDCRSCYKCIRNCPVKSISFHDGQARIIPDECILCGTCYLVCPQGCKTIRDDLGVAESLLSSGQEVVASVAPSYLASFPGVSFDSFKEALIKVGFSDAEETAVGATIVKKEYDRLVDEGKQDVIISTCCHSLNLLVQKYHPKAARYLAPVLSPMLAHAKDIKERKPGAKVIFLGPCIAKKGEIDMYPGLTDCVLTFLELERLFKKHGVTPKEDPNPKKKEESLARLFPIEGGILDTMRKDNPDYEYLAVSGLAECEAALRDIEDGKVHKAFIEMSTCAGSCVNGPAMDADARALIASYLAIKRSAGKKDFKVRDYKPSEIGKSMPAYAVEKPKPSEKEIRDVLSKIGKTEKKDELNCSSCGYATCRDKAIAVIEGKASLEMCLPFLMSQAESLSNTIVTNSDSAVFVVDESLLIRLANPAAASVFSLSGPKDFIGRPITDFFDPELFTVPLSGIPIKDKKIRLTKEDKYLRAFVTYDPAHHIIISFFRDITREEKSRIAQREKAKKTAEITTEVIDKNMRTVQEIASLLGESTAETKVSLNSLKDVLKEDEEGDE